MDDKNNSNGDWKMKVSEWRGYVLRAIEDVEKALNKNEKAIEEVTETVRKDFQEMMNRFDDKFHDHQSEVSKDVRTVHKRLNKIYLKVVAIGATVGVVSAIIFGIFQKYIIKLLGV